MLLKEKRYTILKWVSNHKNAFRQIKKAVRPILEVSKSCIIVIFQASKDDGDSFVDQSAFLFHQIQLTYIQEFSRCHLLSKMRWIDDSQCMNHPHMQLKYLSFDMYVLELQKYLHTERSLRMLARVK